MKKHLLLGFGGLLLLVAGASVVMLLLLRAEAPVSRARCEQIQIGMTWQEVEVRLGGPPGDYTTGRMELDLRETDWEFYNIMTAPEVLVGEGRFGHEWWHGEDGSLWVCFDEQGCVVEKKLMPARRVTFLDKVRRWLGL